MGGNPKTKFVPIHGKCIWNSIDSNKGKTLEYHSSWDWLIPVINKIQKEDNYPKYVEDTSSIFDEGGVYINTSFINVTFKNVIDYIKWNNNIQNQTECKYLSLYWYVCYL